MAKLGLIDKSADYYVPDLYHAYEKNRGPGDPAWDTLALKARARPCPPISMLGVWDTVGALGPPGFLGQILNPGKYKYHDVRLTEAIEHAYQALAIDERRKPFLPALWTRPPAWRGTLEQAWFPGVHANVGGGYEYDGLANEALHWMVEKAEALGLGVDSEYLQYFKPCFNSDLHDSMTLTYRIFGNGTRKLGAQPGDGEALHQAALDRSKYPHCHYAPANLVACTSGVRGSNLPAVTTSRIARGSPCPGPTGTNS
jgi:hypothetical protein